MIIDWTSLTTIVGVIVGGIVTIVREIRASRSVITTEQTASAGRGAARDTVINEIHILVNGRLIAALRMVALLTKREADRTKSPEDQTIYEGARDDLARAEAAAQLIGGAVVPV